MCSLWRVSVLTLKGDRFDRTYECTLEDGHLHTEADVRQRAARDFPQALLSVEAIGEILDPPGLEEEHHA